MAKMTFRWPFDSLVKQLQTRALGMSLATRPTKSDVKIGQFPHCDPRVLHEPGACRYCDAHPDWQELRLVWGINFTGKYEPGKYLCPAEYDRSKEIIERWHGNVPAPLAPVIPTPEEVDQARSEIQRMLTEDDDLT